MSKWQNSSLRLQTRRARMRSAQRCQKQIDTPSSYTEAMMVSSNLRVKVIPIAENVRRLDSTFDSSASKAGEKWVN